MPDNGVSLEQVELAGIRKMKAENRPSTPVYVNGTFAVIVKDSGDDKKKKRRKKKTADGECPESLFVFFRFHCYLKKKIRLTMTFEPVIFFPAY